MGDKVKNQLNDRWKNKMFIVKIVMGLFVLMLILSYTFNNENNTLKQISVAYFEDTNNALTLEQIMDKDKDYKFTPHNQPMFSFGESKASWWIRINTEDIPLHYVNKYYIAIYNPTVAEANLFLPINEKGKVVYRQFNSGWHYQDNKQDEGFFYPVFNLPQSIDYEQPIYIKLYSKFTQNYTIDFLGEKEFSLKTSKQIGFIALLLGILIAVTIYNLIVFIELKDKAYLYYIIYLIFQMIYQCNLLGVFTMYMPKIYHLLMANTITLSLIVMLSLTLFLTKFLNINGNFPQYKVYNNVLFILIIMGIPLDLMKFTLIANCYAHTLSNVGSIWMLYVIVQALYKGFKQAKFFLVGWLIMMTSFAVSLVRHLGYIPNNGFTVNIIFIAVTIETIFLSAAFVGRIKSLNEEKEEALVLFKNAAETATSNEMAFLHAQIKPHFLYNSLNVIASLCRIDPEKARKLILDLSKCIHHTFAYNRAGYQIAFSEELDYVEAYVRIEQARFKDKINMIYELETIENLMIPPLTIQPLVENAIRHGIRKGKGSGTVILRVKNESSQFVIEVQDDGMGMAKEQINSIKNGEILSDSGVGLRNVNRRLQMIYGEALNIESALGQGTKIRIVIPK